MDQPSTSSARPPEIPSRGKRHLATKFKQQRLPAWQPILTARSVLPAFFAIGVVFIPIGIGLLHLSDKVQEIVVNYTDCIQKNGNETCEDFIKQRGNASTCDCVKNFTLDKDFRQDVYIYYGLSNYYQNHRRYVKSRDDLQLLGQLDLEPSSDCDPYTKTSDKIPIAPCGAIANSLFNDTLTLYYKDKKQVVPVLRTEIAWPSDKKNKFKNPEGPTLKEAFKNFAKPLNWKKNIWELDTEIASNNGFENEDFIVWMRTAALPTFRKLYRRVDHSAPGYEALPAGSYELHVQYAYPVAAFKGTKSLIISNTSLLGGKNPFLGIAYITVGTICIFLGVMFLVIHIKYGKKSADVINISPSTSY